MKKKGKIISRILAVTVATNMGSVIPVFADTASTSKVATQVSQTQSVSASHRLSGIDRYATAVAISQKGWSTSDTVILASGENYADALTSGPLAKKYNAPILLTSKTSISSETMVEIGRLHVKNIIIIGSEGAVSSSVVTQLNTAGFSITTRIGGVNRYETSTMVAARLNKPSAVVIVSGQDFPDALSVSSIASKLGYSIILSEKSGLSDSAKKYIATNGIKKAYIIGGQAVLYPVIEKQVTDSVRLAGVNRYETNLEVLKAFEGEFNYDNVFVATGNNFADALAGGALASKSSSPVILVGSSMNTNTADYLVSKENLITKIIALGGEAIVSNSIIKTAIDDKAAIAVTKNYSTAGTYPDDAVSGSVIISGAGVNLKNTTISGDLLIASTVGEGDVDLDNVTVTGKIIINGGGSNSVKLHNMHIKTVEIDKATGESVRVATDPTSSIDTVLVSTSGIVDQTVALKKGSIIVDNNSSVVLKGGFDNVQVNGRGIRLKVVGGSIDTLNVMATSSNTIIDIDTNSLVTNLNVNAAVTVSGVGTITNANIGVNGTTIAITPKVTSVTSGVLVVVNGTTKDKTNSPVIVSVPVGGEIPVLVIPVTPGIPVTPPAAETEKERAIALAKANVKQGLVKFSTIINNQAPNTNPKNKLLVSIDSDKLEVTFNFSIAAQKMSPDNALVTTGLKTAFLQLVAVDEIQKASIGKSVTLFKNEDGTPKSGIMFELEVMLFGNTLVGNPSIISDIINKNQIMTLHCKTSDGIVFTMDAKFLFKGAQVN